MHQQTRELQQSLEERELSAQDLRVWINTLERELDQRGDTEEQLKGQAHHSLGVFSLVSGALVMLCGCCFDFWWFGCSVVFHRCYFCRMGWLLCVSL